MRPAATVALSCLATAAVLYGLALGWPAPDEAGAAWVQDHVSAAAQRDWAAASWPGDSWLGLGVALAASLACLAAGRRRAALAVAALALGNVAVVKATKALLARDRPNGLVLEDFSFPSGHAASTVAAYGLVVLVAMPALAGRWPRLGRLQPFALGLWLGLAFAVGLARVLGGVHWPTDVLAGWAVGSAAVAGGVWLAAPAPAAQPP